MLAAALYASSLFAEEEIYLFTSYDNNEGTHVSHRMDCLDSVCKIESNMAELSLSLTSTQRDQILQAFQVEAKRFNIKSNAKSGDHLIKIKFRYYSDTMRLQIMQRLPVEQLSDISPELSEVFETYFSGLDLSSLGSPEPVTPAK
jgi:hypothetical protein